MKKLMWCLGISATFMMQSCEEKGVKIDFGNSGATDTAYMAAVESPLSRTVLVEEFTGASCTNCPRGHDVVAALLSANPGRVVAVAYHTFNGGNIFKPVNENGHISKYDFRDTLATEIANTIYGGVGSIPVAGIDRVPMSGALQIDRPYWANQTSIRMAVASPVNIHLDSKYNSSDNKVTVHVKVAYTGDVSKKQALTLCVAESHIIDLQLTPDSIAFSYEHNHVLRKFLNPLPYGIAVMDNLPVKQAGQVYEYTMSFVPDPSWKLENCEIVAFISNNEATDKEILQAKEVSLQ